MIMPEDDIVCKDHVKNLLGFNSLYDTCEDSELATGVVVAAVVKGDIYLFQLRETTNILMENSIPVMEGTLLEYNLPPYETDKTYDTYFSISDCRFPTEEELKWYNSMKTV